MLARVVDGLALGLRLLLARGETELTLPHVDDVSENALLLLVESNIFDESSCELLLEMLLLESIKDLSSSIEKIGIVRSTDAT
jgi:hypothetical protein